MIDDPYISDDSLLQGVWILVPLLPFQRTFACEEVEGHLLYF